MADMGISVNKDSVEPSRGIVGRVAYNRYIQLIIGAETW